MLLKLSGSKSGSWCGERWWKKKKKKKEQEEEEDVNSVTGKFLPAGLHGLSYTAEVCNLTGISLSFASSRLMPHNYPTNSHPVSDVSHLMVMQVTWEVEWFEGR